MEFTTLMIRQDIPLRFSRAYAMPLESQSEIIVETHSRLPAMSPQKLRRLMARKKRVDQFLAVFIALPVLPIMLLCMLLVKLTSRGPALYSQKRVGNFGVVFTIRKIRTMYHNCESGTGPRWSVPGDPRVTPLGRVLRHLHIDEFPQLWNVFCGEMSLIGPRPERPEIAGKLRADIADYDWRVAVLPGITGHAQIHLPPDVSVSSVRNKIVMDRYYIHHMSFWMDIKILFLTGLKVLGIRPICRDAGQ